MRVAPYVALALSASLASLPVRSEPVTDARPLSGPAGSNTPTSTAASMPHKRFRSSVRMPHPRSPP
jgi:hypothetical protein